MPESLAGQPLNSEHPIRRTLPGRVAYFAHRRPTEVALRNKARGLWNEISWQTYWHAVEAVGLALHGLGLRAGDHISILSDNRPEWLYADLGAQAIGARSVGIYQTNPAEDVAYILNHSQSKVLFCEDQEQTDKAIEIAERTPSIEWVIVFDPRGLRGYTDPRLMKWSNFLARGEALRSADPQAMLTRLLALDPATAATVVYTSGTTGDPKGALLSHDNLVIPNDHTVEQLGVTEDDTLLSYLPLCHIAEKIFSLLIPLSKGCVVHFGESIGTIQEDLREVSPSIFLGVPRIWEKIHAGVSIKMHDASWLKKTLYTFWLSRGQAIAKRRRAGHSTILDTLLWFVGDLMIFRPLQERLGLRRCRLAISGAAPISSELLGYYHSIGVRILEAYGQTECTGVSHLNTLDHLKLGTVGTGLPHSECRLAQDGEILVRGPHVFVGYLHNDKATQGTMDEAGWLQTGDIGTMDGDFLRITGRKKEIIITSGGKNLSPEKIENTIKMSPFIKEAVAIGDARKFISALIQIEHDAVADWATRREITFTSFEDLTSRPEVRTLIEGEVQKGNEHLARVEQVRAFRLFKKELHQDDGELTATQKVRRRHILIAYEDLIEEMY